MIERVYTRLQYAVGFRWIFEIVLLLIRSSIGLETFQMLSLHVTTLLDKYIATAVIFDNILSTFAP